MGCHMLVQIRQIVRLELALAPMTIEWCRKFRNRVFNRRKHTDWPIVVLLDGSPERSQSQKPCMEKRVPPRFVIRVQIKHTVTGTTNSGVNAFT